MNTYQQPLMEEDNTIMEMKESFILSPSSVNANVAAKEPTFRKAHFLKPLLSNQQLSLNQPPSSSSSGFQPNELKIQFSGGATHTRNGLIGFINFILNMNHCGKKLESLTL